MCEKILQPIQLVIKVLCPTISAVGPWHFRTIQPIQPYLNWCKLFSLEPWIVQKETDRHDVNYSNSYCDVSNHEMEFGKLFIWVIPRQLTWHSEPTFYVKWVCPGLNMRHRNKTHFDCSSRQVNQWHQKEKKLEGQWCVLFFNLQLW